MTSFLFIVKVPVEDNKKDIERNEYEAEEKEKDEVQKEDADGESESKKEEECPDKNSGKDEDKEEIEDDNGNLKSKKEQSLIRNNTSSSSLTRNNTSSSLKDMDKSKASTVGLGKERNEMEINKSETSQQSSETEESSWDFGEDGKSSSSDSKAADSSKVNKVPDKNASDSEEEGTPLLKRANKTNEEIKEEACVKKFSVLKVAENISDVPPVKNTAEIVTSINDVSNEVKKEKTTPNGPQNPMETAKQNNFDNQNKIIDNKGENKKFSVLKVNEGISDKRGSNAYVSDDEKSIDSTKDLQKKEKFAVTKTPLPPVVGGDISLQKDTLLKVGNDRKEKSRDTDSSKSLESDDEKEKVKEEAKPAKKVQINAQVSMAEEQELSQFVEQKTLLEVTEDVIRRNYIENHTVHKTKNGKYYTVMFVVEGGEKCEDVLNHLSDVFIGEREGTSIGIYPSSIYKGRVTEIAEGEDDSFEYEGEFRRSIKARLLVSQVVTAVQANAEFKFDFFMLIITASIIAALGLIESSSVILVASMLVSPLMGPILAGTFGFVIKNVSLRNLGIQSEIKGLIICVINGFLIGLIASSIAVHLGTLGGTESWPTDEMKARGVVRGLIPGLLIALASGIGVALSVLGGNAGSLVGVAISASLLPPAVNAGMLWAHSLITIIVPPPLKPIADIVSINITNQTTAGTDSLDCPHYLNNKYIPVYSCRIELESVYLGLVSISLTILNIICIFIMGIIFLKIKEVAPQTSVADETREFWKDDIKIARESYQTMKGKSSLTVGAQAKKLVEEWRKKQGTPEGEVDLSQFREIIERVENNPEVQDIQKYIPGSNRSRPFSQQLGPEFAPHFEPILSPRALPKNLYHTFHGGQKHSPRPGPIRTGSGHFKRPSTPPPTLKTISESVPETETRPVSPRQVTFIDGTSPISRMFKRRKTLSDSSSPV